MPDKHSSSISANSKVNFIEKARRQLFDKFWEVFIGVIGILMAILLNNSWKYFLVIVLFGVIAGIITHNTKWFPWFNFFHWIIVRYSCSDKYSANDSWG